jgi:hypothetical protein
MLTQQGHATCEIGVDHTGHGNQNLPLQVTGASGFGFIFHIAQIGRSRNIFQVSLATM